MLLPLGSIVYLADGNQKRFIILTKKILTKSYLKVTVMMRKSAMQSFIYSGWRKTRRKW